MRSSFGQPNVNPASRFLAEIPDELVDWRRVGAGALGPGAAGSASGRRPTATDRCATANVPQRSLQPTISLDVGDRVNHDKYGLGTVIASDGAGVRATVDDRLRQRGHGPADADRRGPAAETLIAGGTGRGRIPSHAV